MAAAILDAADTMIVITDRRGVIQYVNPAFTAVTGYARDEALGRTPRLLRSGAQGDEYYRALWSTILGGATWHGELVNRRKDGTLYTDEMTIVPVAGPDGEPEHFVAVKRDVSARVQSLTAASPVGIAHAGADGRLLYVNRRAEELLGGRFEDLIGSGWLARLGAEDRELVLADVARAYRSPSAEVGQGHRLLLPSGRWVHLRAAPLVAGVGPPLGVVLSLEDVTAETVAAEAVAQRERLARGILDSLADATVVVDASGAVVALNAAWNRLVAELGGDLGAAGVGASYLEAWAALTQPDRDDVASMRRGVAAVLAGEAPAFEHEYPSGAGGRRRWYLARVTPFTGYGGAVVAQTDVTWRKEAEARLAFAARNDGLTGLLNRSTALEVLASELERSAGHYPVSVLFLDLDGFKAVNDTLGHAAGDEVLRATAARIRANVRDTDAVARMGGDEFLVVLADRDGSVDLAPVVDRLAAALSAPYRLAAGPARVGASVGWATATPDDSPDTLVARADGSMYEVKQSRHRADSTR